MYLDHKKTLKKTRIKQYNTLALPVLLCGSETWTIKARDARRITAAEMKYMRRTANEREESVVNQHNTLLIDYTFLPLISYTHNGDDTPQSGKATRGG